jgi:hypothetical protein
MNLHDIIYRFVDTAGVSISDDDRVSIVLREVPYLAYEAGVLAEQYYESAWLRHDKPYMRKYVLNYHEFNSVEISRLVRALKNFVLNACKKRDSRL